jgi:cytochrome c oxidase assembly factor CtaG
MKSCPALLVAVLLVLAAPSTVLTQSIDLDGYFDDRLAGSFTVSLASKLSSASIVAYRIGIVGSRLRTYHVASVYTQLLPMP